MCRFTKEKMAEFLKDLKLKTDEELLNILIIKINHLNERIANPPEIITEQILQIASMKINVIFHILLLFLFIFHFFM